MAATVRTRLDLELTIELLELQARTHTAFIPETQNQIVLKYTPKNYVRT